MGDIVDQCPSDASTRACVDEAVLRSRVERIPSTLDGFAIHHFGVDELGMQDDIALLADRLQVGQAFPRDEVAGACDASCGCGGAEVAWASVIVALNAEDAVDPAVLVLRQAHVVDIRCGHVALWQGDRLGPEAPAVDAIGRFGHGEETLTIGTLDATDHQITAIQLDGACVQHGIDHNALHQVGVVLGREVVAPLQGRMLSREDGEFIFLIDAIAPRQGFVGALEQLLVMCPQAI